MWRLPRLQWPGQACGPLLDIALGSGASSTLGGLFARATPRQGRPPAAQLLQASVTGGTPADVSRPASIGFPGRESTQAGGGRGEMRSACRVRASMWTEWLTSRCCVAPTVELGDGSEMSVISHGVASGSDHTDAIATEMRPQKSPERSVFRFLQRPRSKYCIGTG